MYSLIGSDTENTPCKTTQSMTVCDFAITPISGSTVIIGQALRDMLQIFLVNSETMPA